VKFGKDHLVVHGMLVVIVLVAMLVFKAPA